MSTHAVWRARRGAGIPPVLGLQQFRDAHERIAGIAARTPMKICPTLSERLGVPVHLKIETMQPTGAFKIRGAANHLSSLTDDERRRGVITVSTGNHGRAVAYVAQKLGIRCVVCLSCLVPRNKVDSIRTFGAELDIGGANQDAALERALARAAAEGLILVSPFDDLAIIGGQGTLALEILEDVPDTGTIVVPLSGGGLAAGVAMAAKSVRPSVRILAVASERCPAMLRSLEAGRPVEVPEYPSLADSLGGGIGLNNRFSFALVRDFVDEIHLVDDREIATALRFAFHNVRLVLEGAAAAPLAALQRSGKQEFLGPVVAVATGDNIEPAALLHILNTDAPAKDARAMGE